MMHKYVFIDICIHSSLNAFKNHAPYTYLKEYKKESLKVLEVFDLGIRECIRIYKEIYEPCKNDINV